MAGFDDFPIVEGGGFDDFPLVSPGDKVPGRKRGGKEKQPQSSTALGRVYDRVTSAVGEGFGDQPIVSLEGGVRNALQDVGLVTSDKTRFNPATNITSPAIEIGVNALDTGLRGINAITRGFSGLVGGIGEELGQSPTQSRRLERETNALIDIGSIPAGVAPIGAASTANRLANASRATRRANEARDILETSERLGVRPSIPAVSDSRVVGASQNFLRDVPLASGRIERNARGNIDQLQNARQGASPINQPVSSERVGEVVRGRVEHFIENTSRDRVRDAFGDAYRTLPQGADTPVPVNAQGQIQVPNLRNAITEVTERRGRAGLEGTGVAGEAGNAIDNLIQNAIQNPTIQGLRDLRTRLGDLPAIQARTGERSLSQAQIARLYGALTDDIFALARQEGGAAAVNAFRHADRVTEVTAELKQRLRSFVGNKSDEKIFDSIVSMAKAKGPADFKGLRRVFNVLNENERRTVQSGIIQRMGSPAPGAGAIDGFSPSTFSKNFRELSGQSLNLLFTGSRNALQSVRDLARISERYERIADLANHSGTGRANLFYGVIGGGAVLDPMTTTASLLGSYGLARMLTSARAARAYVNMLEAYADANEAVRGLARATPRARRAVLKYSANLNNLKNVISRDGDLKEDADSLASALKLEKTVSRGE